MGIGSGMQARGCSIQGIRDRSGTVSSLFDEQLYLIRAKRTPGIFSSGENFPPVPGWLIHIHLAFAEIHGHQHGLVIHLANVSKRTVGCFKRDIPSPTESGSLLR